MPDIDLYFFRRERGGSAFGMGDGRILAEKCRLRHTRNLRYLKNFPFFKVVKP